MRSTFLAALASLCVLPCTAGTILPASVSASSTYFSYDVNNLINGSGLSGGLHDNNWQNMWITNQTTTGTLVFDLGGVFQVTSASVWNYNADCCGLGRGVQDMSIDYSLDGFSYTSAGNFTLTEGTGASIPADSLGLGNVTARYIRFDLNSNYGDTGYIGLSEVQFAGTSAVPEPSASALLSLGLGALVVIASL